MVFRGLEEKKDPFIRKIREVQPWDWDRVSHLYLGRGPYSLFLSHRAGRGQEKTQGNGMKEMSGLA